MLSPRRKVGVINHSPRLIVTTHFGDRFMRQSSHFIELSEPEKLFSLAFKCVSYFRTHVSSNKTFISTLLLYSFVILLYFFNIIGILGKFLIILILHYYIKLRE